MSSNYKTHLEFELRSDLSAKQELIGAANKLEAIWKATMRERQECESRLHHLQTIEATQMEAFREAHSRVVLIAQTIGELQDERFSSCEDEEDWLH